MASAESASVSIVGKYTKNFSGALCAVASSVHPAGGGARWAQLT